MTAAIGQTGSAPKVFISSTAEDLVEHRKEAREAAQYAGFYPEMHEYWPAKDNPPYDECMQRVDGCAVLVVLVAHRYGWEPPDQPESADAEKKSITWLECERALSLTPEQLRAIEAIAMDMCAAYVRSAREHVEDADSKICFDRFHVAKLLNDAVNTVRRQENRELAAAGEHVPPGTKYIWTQNPENMPQDRRVQFELLRDCSLKAGRAWAIKDAARWLWNYVSRAWALKAWKRWIGWAMRSRLEPMKKVGRTIRAHMWGIINAIVLRVTNAGAESQNAKIQWIKKQACGFRNRHRFRNAIYFHLGGLDLYPRPGAATHTTS